MYGDKYKIGLIIPSANTIMEPELANSLPSDVSLHASRMRQTYTSRENQKDMRNKMVDSADLLKTANVDLIIFGCTSGSFVDGVGSEEEIEIKLEKITGGIPSIATAASIKRAFTKLAVTSIAMSTPYPEEFDELETQFLEQSGFDVVDNQGPNFTGGLEKGEVTSEEVMEHVINLDVSGADGVFISCTNYRTFDIVNKIEEYFDKPVVTSNQATLWDALNQLDIDYSDIELGSLYDT